MREGLSGLQEAFRVLRSSVPQGSHSRGPYGAGDNQVFLTRQKGFQNLKLYNGEGGSAKWKEWRFGIMHWVEQEYPAVARLIRRVEKLDMEPKEPEDESTAVTLGHAGFGSDDTLNKDEEWACEQIWSLLVDKATSNAHNMIIGLDNAPRSRGVRAWFKLALEATGTLQVRTLEVTEKLHAPDRKRVAAKDLVAALEEEDSLIREYTELTGIEFPEAAKILNLRKNRPLSDQ